MYYSGYAQNTAYGRLFIQKYGLFILFAIALMLDTLSTMKFMIEDGINGEFHPLVRLGAWVYGPILGTFLTAFVYKLLAAFALIRVLGKYSRYFLTLSICTSFFAAMYNVWGYYFYI